METFDRCRRMTMNNENNMIRQQNGNVDKPQEHRTVTPAVDIYENDTEVLLVADLPGVKPENLNLRVDNGELNIEATRTYEKNGTTTGEESFEYLRSFRVPKTIDAEKIGADLKNGVLKVHLPKMEQVRPRKISVKAG